ncbi:MAG: SH3 domain-containing protein [Lachnospiraceae bacterium]|nr:SH3 domain-containing protein [Lachnospiraceae bacterium]
MKKRNTKFLLYTGLISLMVSVTGCTSVLPIGSDPSAAVTQAPTQSADSQTDVNLLYTSDNGSLTITLPDSSWKNTADSDSRRTFLSEETGILTISHSVGDYADTVTLPKTQAELEALLLTKPTVATVSESPFTSTPHTVVSFSFQSGTVANSYYYELSYEEGNDVRYEIVWGMQAAQEIIEVVGKLYTADEAQADKLRNAIMSTQVTDSNYTGIIRSASSYTADNSDSTGSVHQYRCIQSANIRSKAGMDGSSVLGEMSVGEVIDVTAEENGWLEFQYNGQTAYVYGEYMEAVTSNSPSPTDPVTTKKK